MSCVTAPNKNNLITYNSTYTSSIKPISHLDSKINIDNLTNEIVLTFESSKKILYLAYLKAQNEKIENATLIQPTDNGIIIKVLPPQKGEYELIIYGKKKTDEGSFSGLLKYEISIHNYSTTFKKYPNYLSTDDYIINYDVGIIAKTRPVYDYTEIDDYVANTPASVEKNIKQLTEYLIKPAKNELEKTRAIFKWITNNIEYDTDAYFSKNINEAADYRNTFESHKAVCSGYGGLFSSMARYAGLKSVEISGYGKGYSYTPEMKTQAKQNPESIQSNHEWNAVEIDNEWYLLDATWAAGVVNSDKDFERQYNEYYFLTLPKDFIYNHYPFGDPKWQLLDYPISKAEYFELDKESPEAPKHRLRYSNEDELGKSIQPVSHKNAYNTVPLSQEKIVLVFKINPMMNFLIKVKEKNQEIDDAVTFRKDNDQLFVELAFKKTGAYDIILYGNIDNSLSYDGVMRYHFVVN